jgi:uncharacterized protein with von Willebrand factor type A (vWA) domain
MSALAANVMHFGRVLRSRGLPAGPEKTATAIEALQLIDISRRSDVFHALHAVFVGRHTDSKAFSLAFDRFWQGSGESSQSCEPSSYLGCLESAVLSHNSGDDALSGSWSAAESLHTKDFAAMSPAERAEARRLMAELRLPVSDMNIRRFRAGYVPGPVDMRATYRAMVRSNGLVSLKYKRRIKRQPALVVLCDISGSMEPYARMLLHFLHVLSNDQDRMHTFLFGTRLTNVTRQLAARDSDRALTDVANSVMDWSGGTRIGETIATFNRLWSRRVLAQGAVVLLITDGLDRAGGWGLGEEVQRLRKSCRRLIWLNPLLRYAAFEPKSAGIRAMLPHVDDFRPVHNLDSLKALVTALNAPVRRKTA